MEEASKQIRTAVALVEAAFATSSAVVTSGATSLVEGPNWLCSSDLMCLLLRGKIDKDNGSTGFGAYDTISKHKNNFYLDDNGDGNKKNNKKVGVLSMMEIDQGIPIADDLKFVDTNVWVVHTGDHFMTMRKINDNPTPASDNQTIELEIFDGLKPSGPGIKRYSVKGDTSLASKAPENHIDTFKKKRVGQPDDIVQAKKKTTGEDGSNNNITNYKEWTFEVVPAINDPDVEGPIDDDPNEPIYDFKQLLMSSSDHDDSNSPWRCATCYANRFKTMNFGTNEPGTKNCSVCGLSKGDAMWSLWLPYDKLSPRMQRRARHMYAPKLELTISTLYPKADIVEI